MRFAGIYRKYLSPWVVVAIGGSVFVLTFLYLGQKDITNPYFIFHNPAYPIVSHAHGWLYVVQALVLVFLSITVLELFSLYIGTARRLFTDKKEQEFNRDTLNQMMDYLTKESSTADARKLRALTKSKSEKRLFVNQLRISAVLTKGKVHDDCITLFHEMNFNDVVKKNLRSPYVRDKMFALRVAGDFQLSEFNPSIAKYIYSKNDIVRSEAIQAYVKVNADSDLSFLTDYTHSLSLLDFNEIVNAAKHYRNIHFESLFSSPNAAVRAIGIRLAVIQNKTEFKPLLLPMIEDKTAIVREEAYGAIIAFATEKEDFKALISHFDNMNKNLQLKLIDEITLRNERDFVSPFLEELILKYPSDIKIRAMSNLIKMDISFALKYMNHENESIRNAYKHLTDFYL
ncbi:MAG TPA: hypothetical protein PL097_00530 [Dysgonamonadaceae bacterium]|jgi:hypothetical protein|nr:hypothetical protein [Dysgonamonadaceae bacterium]HOT63830.1 hypothetical protein [Dysgonamonadaceae bacterium]HOV35695.1 hypothetical protein [Dysgonamonadaceae bacterium]HPD42835.1 hypothetical protein [Dysgonamonadaceae bacterium]HQG07673.1 hypothetical protein [Dysgonamonadaceae bacterium]